MTLPIHDDPQAAEFYSSFNRLDETNKYLFGLLIHSLSDRDTANTKIALDRLIRHNGSSPDLLALYATFGIVPYVVEVSHA